MAAMGGMKIKTKIIAGFAAVLVITVLLGIVALKQLGTVYDEGNDMASQIVPGLVKLQDMDSALGLARRSELQATTSTGQDLDNYETRLGKSREEFKAAMDAYSKFNLTAEEKKILAECSIAEAKYFEQAKKTFALSRAGKSAEAVQLVRQVSKKDFDATMKPVDDLIEYNTKESIEGKHHIDAAQQAARIWVAAFIALSVCIGIFAGLLVMRSITRPLQALVQAAEKIAGGDLNVVVANTTNDEIGELAGSFATMVENLRNLISKMSETSSMVASAAHQLMATSEQIATGAEEVAAQAGTVATAGEEMSATSGDIAQNCMMAAEGSHQASSTASAGAEVVNATVQVMARIADRVKGTATTVESLGARSDQIGEIIGTIQDIADQTNLLALNAAIEAARAGEQGRGFAVVADEVRALAERTTKATREIGEMIKAIQSETKSAVVAMEEGVKEVERGTGEASKSGQALQEILEQINAVTMQVNQIATAAEEQTATTSEISSNIHQITEVVQDTAKGAQESATAAMQLSRLAEELQRLVGQFRL